MYVVFAYLFISHYLTVNGTCGEIHRRCDIVQDLSGSNDVTLFKGPGGLLGAYQGRSSNILKGGGAKNLNFSLFPVPH